MAAKLPALPSFDRQLSDEFESWRNGRIVSLQMASGAARAAAIANANKTLENTARIAQKVDMDITAAAPRLRLLLRAERWEEAMELSQLAHVRKAAFARDENDHSSMDVAIANGPVEIARALSKGATRRELSDLLASACAAGRADHAEWLLGEGANPDSGRWRTRSPLWWAMARSSRCAIMLLAAGASIKTPPRLAEDGYSPGGHLPLLAAAHSMNIDCVELGLSLWDPKQADALGRTSLMLCASPSAPLHLGIPAYDPQVPEALIAAGADIEARDAWGLRAIERASVFGARSLFERLLPSCDLEAPTPSGEPLRGFLRDWAATQSFGHLFGDRSDSSPLREIALGAESSLRESRDIAHAVGSQARPEPASPRRLLL